MSSFPIFTVDRCILRTGQPPYGDNAWVFRRADEIRRAFLDNEHFSVTGSPDLAKFFGEEWGLIPIHLDPPDHSAYRQLLNPIFSPKRIELLAASVESEAKRLVDKFADRGSCDLMAEFATGRFRSPFSCACWACRWMKWTNMWSGNISWSTIRSRSEGRRRYIVFAPAWRPLSRNVGASHGKTFLPRLSGPKSTAGGCRTLSFSERR